MGCMPAGGAHAMSYFPKKGKNNSYHLLQRDKSNQEAIFLNYSNFTSSFQLSITPKTMSSGTVHAVDLCTIAQGLLAATKTCWK
jgi:hypothetical protein